MIKKILCLICAMGTFCGFVSADEQKSENADKSKVYIKLQPVRYVSAGHILVDTYEEAEALKKRIDNGESFEKLAQLYSKCPSSERGGALGSFGRGQMVKPFENAAFNLHTGEVSEPVKTEFGWHIIKVYDRKL